jgi:hypothetical protein
VGGVFSLKRALKASHLQVPKEKEESCPPGLKARSLFVLAAEKFHGYLTGQEINV